MSSFSFAYTPLILLNDDISETAPARIAASNGGAYTSRIVRSSRIELPPPPRLVSWL